MAFNSGIPKLQLEEALPQNDNPQNRSLVKLFEQDSQHLKKYIIRLQERCQQLVNAQRLLTTAASRLSEHLKLYELKKFPLDSDEDSILTTTVQQFSKTLDELSSCYQVVSTQLADGMIFPLSKFLDADFNELDSLNEIYHSSIAELDQVTTRYSKVSKRKESDKLRSDINEEYHSCCKKLHKVSLNYYAQLNALQYKRKTAIIEPMLACLHAYKSHFTIGNDSLNTEEIDNFLSNIGASVQGVYSELAESTQSTVKHIELIEEQGETIYYAEQPPSNLHSLPPPNTMLNHKSGYLFLRSKFAGMVTRWDKVFVFTQGANLMYINHGDVAGGCIMELDFRVTAQHTDHEDRRCVFQITNGKKNVTLQALSSRERDEWIASIRNIVKEGGYTKEKDKSQSGEGNSKVDRSCNFYVGQSQNDVTVSGARKSADDVQASTSRSHPSATCNPIDGLNLDTPIQFDLLGPNDEDIDHSRNTGEVERINPFGDSIEKSNSSDETVGAYHTVRLLGSTAVKDDRGDRVIYDTMRRVMAARAIYNIFKMTEARLCLSESGIRLVDPTTQATRISFPLKDVSYWSAHKENTRLFGFIARIKLDNESLPSFTCYIFESDISADEICDCLRRLTHEVHQKMIEAETENVEDDHQPEVNKEIEADDHQPEVNKEIEADDAQS